MFVFSIVVGGLLFGLGGLIAFLSMSSSVAPWDASWDEIKAVLRKVFHDPGFLGGLTCFVIGFFMLFAPLITAFKW